MSRLILVLGDQLSFDLASLRDRAPTDHVMMAEVRGEARYVPHHPQKIVLFLSAMRKFAAQLEAEGMPVLYSKLEDAETGPSLRAEVLRRYEETGAREVVVVRPGDWRLTAELESLPVPVRMLADDRFICPPAVFEDWAKGRKQFRMEWFYREMRRRTGLLMEGEARDQPVGGQWNFDHDNRKPAKPDLMRVAAKQFKPDAVVTKVMTVVGDAFPDHFGTLDAFHWPTDRAQALEALDHFIAHILPRFGDEQDAMLRDDPVLSHSLLSPCINLGLLSPLEVCKRAEAAYFDGTAPLNAVEGFIRQILGWREYMRGIWAISGPDYLTSNYLNQTEDLPPAYWGAPTKMACLGAAVAQTRDLAYAHHIQRLMVTGNFALLAGVSPQEVEAWYHAVYIDAIEWVEAPNTLGMSQFADGGLLGSKPYVSSGSYINKMSDYCGGCAYRVKDRTGKDACPFNLLYWDFLIRHRETLGGNPRMAQMYRTWDKMAATHRDVVIKEAGDFLRKLRAGEPV
ncbi:cryptochrome/photolyase family protein [Albirhodobacter sp. R86504]|uniref:cryptochrome/photolyase family protein n=1 Tax=Albirhodobacter sp. R86504 TaxID=3093848 RepID=UPI00366B0562